MRKEINNISCVGSGTIGAGWVARLLVNKIKVKVYDLTPFQETRLKIVIENTKSANKNLLPDKKIKFESVRSLNPQKHTNLLVVMPQCISMVIENKGRLTKDLYVVMK